MTTKIAVSLPDDQVAAARRAVAEGRAPSVSAYVARAIADRLDYDDVASLLETMASAGGLPTDDDRRWARQALGLE
jgi:Arc/MetJ-type ribon-helix-helix transcriptional regulator